MSKLTKQDKIDIYNYWKNYGKTSTWLSNKYGVNLTNIRYMLKLIDHYGINILDSSYSAYTIEFKEEAIRRVLINNEIPQHVSLDLALPSQGLIHNWIRKYKEDGYNVINHKKGKPSHEKQRPTIYEVQDQEILKLIKQLEEEHKFSVGYNKMTRLINLSQELEYRVNKKRIRQIMNQYGIRADYRQPKRKRAQERQIYEAENILNRQFKQTAVNQVWVTNTTELTYGIRYSKVRLHVVLDLYGQYPISWLITPTETSEGAIRVFEQAQASEGKVASLIHTDRGAAYTSRAFNQYLAINGAGHSYSAPGTPADNAVIEHWWADFKAIWICPYA
ncbi:IS3 family transposase [Limosilactobacillus agrestis]|uniref:IS3 family transposase n=1 Tax=Limosilactobacillus agrestis TaxID=2759748 RepID=UPI0039DFBDB3